MPCNAGTPRTSASAAAGSEEVRSPGHSTPFAPQHSESRTCALESGNSVSASILSTTEPPGQTEPVPDKSRQSMLAGLSICARHCGRQAGRPSRPVGSARSGRRGSRNPAARRVCHGAQEVAEPWSSPEEVGRPGGRHQFPGIKGLWLGDVHERIHRIHQQRPLAQEWRPHVALGVEV